MTKTREDRIEKAVEVLYSEKAKTLFRKLANDYPHCSVFWQDGESVQLFDGSMCIRITDIKVEPINYKERIRKIYKGLSDIGIT